ncbi:MAG: 3-oxoacyl-ACP reductase FabG, partial [Gammaproteobacteria bacterium]
MMKSVLITGSSRGIGKAIALRLAKDGYHVVLHYCTNQEAAEQALVEITNDGGNGHIVQFDIADRNQTAQILQQDIDANEAYYGVVCNAGVARDAAFPALTEDDWDEVIHTNLDGFYNVLQPIVMPMVRRRKPGRIITLSSVSGLMGNRGQVNYSAAKAGIIGASKALAIELAKRNITVNCVAPGLIETEMVQQVQLDEALKMIPLRRMGTAQEVAGLVSYLCSEDAAYITRQVISINGGMF